MDGQLSLLLLILSVFATSVFGQELVASLDYGNFQGSYSSTYDISYWRKIPFAAPPTGKIDLGLLSRQPQLAMEFITLTKALICVRRELQVQPRSAKESTDTSQVNGSEDCLYLGLYTRPWNPPQALRPVVVVFYGGGFIQGSASFTLPPTAFPVLNVSNTNDLIFVYANYRVNAFGFLPGVEIASSPTSDLNPGLLDQQAALKWTNKYIEKFGGDPKNVSIWGQSAGAGSVLAQVIANGGKTNPPLFSKALASSPYWPKTYKYDAPEAQAIYDNFAKLAGCVGPESLVCLKGVDVQTLRNAALAVGGSHTYNTSSFTWAPVIDGSFLTQSLSQAAIKGQVNIDYGFGLYNSHEGENFIPPGLKSTNNAGTPAFNSSIASFDTWLRGFLSGFSDHSIQQVKALYPESGSTETITYNTTYTRAGLIYRDTVLACPAYWTARAAHNKSYVGEYTISPAKHASDTQYWNQVNPIQVSQPLIYKGFTGAFASFFQTGDPNAHKLTNGAQAGVPDNWLTGEEFVIVGTGFENLKLKALDERCRFWTQVADQVPI